MAPGAGRGDFSTAYPSGPHTVDGTLLNRFGSALNRAAASSHGGHGHGVFGLIQGTANAPQFIQGVALVLDAADTCEEDDGERQAPCGKEGLYRVAFRPYNHADAKWIAPEQDGDFLLVAMDCRGHEIDAETAEARDDLHRIARPVFEAGDTVVCYWDSLANAVVPVESVDRRSFIDAESSAGNVTAITASGGTGCNLYAGIDVDLRRGDGWQAITGRDVVLNPPDCFDDYITGTMFFSVPDCQNGTRFRIVAAIGDDAPGDFYISNFGIQLKVDGEKRSEHAHPYIPSPAWQPLSGFREHAYTRGNCGVFFFVTSDYVEVRIPDGSPEFSISGQFRVEWTRNPDSSSSSQSSSSQSSSSSSSSSPSSQSSFSSQSDSTSTSQTSNSSSTSASSLSSSSTSSQSSSSQSSESSSSQSSSSETSANSSSSQSSTENFLCIPIMTGLQLDEDCRVTGICTQELCIPRTIPATLGAESCAEVCTPDSSQSSESSSDSTSANSSNSSSTSANSSSSSQSSSSQSVDASSQSSSSTITAECLQYSCIWDWTGSEWSVVGECPVDSPCVCPDAPTEPGTFVGEQFEADCIPE